jgi:predicted nucleotidyltransferase
LVQPERQFMGAELIRQVGRGTGAVHRQLKQFASSGLVTITRRANQTYYQADRQNPIFEDLQRIILKTTGLAVPLRQALDPFAQKILAAFVFGSVASGRERSTSDLDLLILTTTPEGLSYGELYAALEPVEQLLGRPITPVVMTVEEWRTKTKVKDSFADRVAKGDLIMILGDRHDVG